MSQLLTTTIAADRAEKALGDRPTVATIIAWCVNWGIGFKVGGRWQVDPAKLDEFLQGKRNEENQT